MIWHQKLGELNQKFSLFYLLRQSKPKDCPPGFDFSIHLYVFFFYIGDLWSPWRGSEMNFLGVEKSSCHFVHFSGFLFYVLEDLGLVCLRVLYFISVSKMH